MKFKIWIVMGLILTLSIIIVFNLNSNTTLDFLGNKSTANEKDKGFNFAIYMVNDEVSRVEDIKDLNNIILEDNPVISDNDVLSYDFNEHNIVITDNCYKSLLEKEGIYSKYFMVVAEGECIYMGMFRLIVHSFLPNTSVIYIDNMNTDKIVNITNGVVLNIKAPYSAPDMRSDPRIANALKNLGVMK